MSNEKNGDIFIREFSIIDDISVEHKCILAGVLDVYSWEDEVQDVCYNTKGKKNIEIISTWTEKKIDKTLSFGLSITNPGDTFNFDMGVMIAVGRATKPSKTLGVINTSSRSMLGPEMIECLMDQQLKYIINNKGKFLKCNGPMKIEQVKSDDLPF